MIKLELTPITNENSQILALALEIKQNPKAPTCKNCKNMCFCKSKGRLPVESSITLLKSLNENGKIANPAEFDSFVKTLSEDINETCLKNYDRGTNKLRSQLFPPRVVEAFELSNTLNIRKKAEGN